MYPLAYSRLPRRFVRFSSVAAQVGALLCAIPAVAQEGTEAGATSAPGGGADVASLYGDFVHFARLGRFDAAEAYATRLLEHPDLDPVGLLEAAERNRGSIETLIVMMRQSSIAGKARQVLEVIRRGERDLRRDPARIKQNIRNLGGPPQTEYNAIGRLKESGEYAVRWMVDALVKPDYETLRPRIVRALPQIGKDAVNPLAIALQSTNDHVQEAVARALGQIGYPHATPYLQKLLARDGITGEVKHAAAAALAAIEQRPGPRFATTPAESFVRLAELYYDEQDSVRADPRWPEANLWFLRDGFLTAVPVPTEIFGPVMAMRCCEQALRFEPNRTDAIALWLAANIRREARLGLDIESGEPGASTEKDPSRPDDFPRSIYFSRAAGPLYAHRVLARAVHDGDSAVALGAIAALRVTAGETFLVGTEDYKQSLVQALRFPDRLVRIKAALALADALPKSSFAGSEAVPGILAGALVQTGQPQYVVVDPDESNLNRVLAELRGQGAAVLGDSDLYKAMEQARKEFETVSCLFIATDVGGPGFAQIIRRLREDVALATTPIVLLIKREHVSAAEEAARTVPGIERVDANADAGELADAAGRALAESGQAAVDPALALRLALETAEVLRRAALDGRTVIRWERTEPALISALNRRSEELRIKVASVLACVSSAEAQRALAQVALNDDNSESLRIAVFAALAESARRNGNRLDQTLIAELIEVAADEPALPLRTAASQALGALNLTTNKASEIIRKYDQG